MTETIERFEDKKTGYYAELCFDDDPMNNPRDWDNIGKMVCSHRKYNLGDIQLNSREEVENFHAELDENKNLILPLYLYDHSGITMSTKPFSCPWDSGQVGVIYVSHDDIKKEWGIVNEETLETAKKVLESEVSTYDDYITGQVYSYVIYNEDDEIEDSLHGIYGRDYAEEEAKSALQEITKDKEAVFTSMRAS